LYGEKRLDYYINPTRISEGTGKIENPQKSADMGSSRNAFGKSEEYWLGYLAGMIDGEGTVILAKTVGKNTKTVRYTPIVVIYNNCLEVLKFLREITGGAIRKCHGHTFKLTVQQRKLLPILKKLQLIIKKRQLELLLEAYNYFDIKHKWGIKGRPFWAENKLEQIYQQIKKENRKYRGLK
jgi:hypothetical protein